MKELISMWGNTRMIVLAAISGGAYAAILIPFKVFQIIPGFTEIRPGNVVPCLCSFMFGPAAAWGAGFGNLIGDLVGGQFGFGSAFGFIGNFTMGYIPYRMWMCLSEDDPLPKTCLDWVKFLFTLLFACASCASIIALGIHMLGFMPFPALAVVILPNSFLVNLVLCAPLLAMIYPRVKKMGLLYTDIMPAEALPKRGRGRTALMLVGVVVIVGTLCGIAPEIPKKFLHKSANPPAPATSTSKDASK